MLELNRIMLRNFGPVDARYEDVTLDLSGIGDLIAEPALIDADHDAGHASRRPSEASLLLLPNGGGKGILLHALQSTITPSRHRDTESLNKFTVSARQPTHVVLEWANRQNGQLLVTAQLLAPPRKGGPARHFYTFRPGPKLQADQLPFIRDGKWTSFDDYLAFVKEQQRDSALECSVLEGQEAWEALQERLGLVPDLFAIQWKMNASEGAAGTAFARSSARHFIEWLLRQVSDADRYASLESGFNDYSREIGQHDSLRTQHAYATTMQSRCQDVHDTHVANQEAGQQQEAAAQRLAALSAAITHRRARLDDDVETAQLHAAAAKEDVDAHEQKLDVSRRRRHFVVLRDLEMQQETQQAQCQELSEHVHDAELDHSAWSAVGVAIGMRSASHALGSLRETIQEAEDASAAAARRLETAAARVRVAYTRTVEAMQGDVTVLTNDIEDRQSAIDEWRKEIAELRSEVTRSSTQVEQFQNRVEDAESALARARHDGLVTPDEDAAAAFARLTQAEEQTAEALSGAEHDLVGAERAAASTRRHAQDKANEAAAEAHKAAQMQRDLDRWRSDARGVLSAGLVSDLSETDQSTLDEVDALLWLDAHADHLSEQCEVNISAAERAQVQPRRVVEEAERLLASLDTRGGLLPPRRAVSDVCKLLQSHGVAAVSGWQWLRDNTPAQAHHNMIVDHPELVDGVIVNSDDDVDTARTILDEAELLPQAAVAVAASQSFDTTPTGLNDGRAVPRPTPALHNEEAAEQERRTVEQRHTDNRERLRELDERIAALRTLAANIRVWRRNLNSEPSDLVVERAATARRYAQDLKDAAENAESEASAASTAFEDAKTRHNELSEKLVLTRGDRQTADQLQHKIAQAVELQRQISDIEIANHKRQQQIETLGATVSEAETDFHNRRDELTKTQVRIAEYQSAREGITCPDNAEQRQLDDPTPLPELPELKADYDRAEHAYREATIGNDLTQQATALQLELTGHQRRWGDFSKPVQYRAEELRHDPRAATEAERRIALHDLADRLSAARTAKEKAGRELSKLDERINASKPSKGRTRWLDDHEGAAEWTPTDFDHAERLIQLAGEQIADSESKLSKAKGSLTGLSSQFTQLERLAQRFKLLESKTLEAARGLQAPPAADPCSESIDDVKKHVDTAITAHRESQNLLRGCTQRLQKAVGQLKLDNERHEFSELDVPLQKQISATPDEHLPALMPDWTVNFQQYSATINTDLALAEDRRGHIVGYVTTHVRDALRLLRRAERAARVPDGDSPWAGQEFLSIKFAHVSDDAIESSARIVVDRLARHHRDAKTHGIDLVLACLREAVSSGFAVKILKPTPVGGTSMVPIERMGKEFSGGQDLTGSILLYCVLAVMKTADRTSRGNDHGGTLLLDNPLGRANAEYLMDLQFQIAKAMNVQLICTTPLSEDRSILRFPLQIHMINDVSIRQGASLIRVSKETRELLAPPLRDPDSDTEAPRGLVGAARINRKDSGT